MRRSMGEVNILLMAVLLLTGCAARNVELIWRDAGGPDGIQTPRGFAVTPGEAYRKVWDERRLSLKHIWHIYADDTNYYVMDSFFGSSPRRAVVTGIVIDGRTGEVREQTSSRPHKADPPASGR